MKRKLHLDTAGFAMGVALLACPVSGALALTVTNPGQVLMIDGTDNNVTVNVSAADVTFPVGQYDFGFLNGSNYTLITGSTGSHVFQGGDIVNFALRDRGADNTFGTSDDQIYDIANPLDYANQTYTIAIAASNSQNPVVTSPYYRSLLLTWDLNLDSNPDAGFDLAVTSPLFTNDGFAPTAVPLPAAAWLLASGLLAIGTMRRNRRD